MQNIKRPEKAGVYKFKPFWHGEDQPIQEVTVYESDVVISDEGETRPEMVFDYQGYTIIVCATDPNRWYK
jgi:hypothetical protein